MMRNLKRQLAILFYLFILFFILSVSPQMIIAMYFNGRDYFVFMLCVFQVI